MAVTTREQRVALKRLWQRGKLRGEIENELPTAQGKTYLQFRRMFAVPFENDPFLFGGPWLGMHFGIEPDGYTHT